MHHSNYFIIINSLMYYLSWNAGITEIQCFVPIKTSTVNIIRVFLCLYIPKDLDSRVIPKEIWIRGIDLYLSFSWVKREKKRKSNLTTLLKTRIDVFSPRRLKDEKRWFTFPDYCFPGYLTDSKKSGHLGIYADSWNCHSTTKYINWRFSVSQNFNRKRWFIFPARNVLKFLQYAISQMRDLIRTSRRIIRETKGRQTRDGQLINVSR